MTSRFVASLRLLAQTYAKELPANGFIANNVSGNKATGDLFGLMASSPVSLSEFHFAYLTCPVFQLELRILSLVGATDKMPTQDELWNVATGSNDDVAIWAHKSRDGDPMESDTNSTVIMRASWTPVKPFCDTYWSVNKNELQFGTSLIDEMGITMKASLPAHYLYSRILLASTAENLQRLRATNGFPPKKRT